MEDLINIIEEIQCIKTVLLVRAEPNEDLKFERMLNISPSDHPRISRNYWHLSEADLEAKKENLEKSLNKKLENIIIEKL